MRHSHLPITPRSLRGLNLLFVAMFLGTSIQAATISWSNNSTDFNSTSSWTGGVLPGSADSANFSVAPVNQPNLTGNITVGQISFNNAAASGYTITGNATTFITLLSVGSSGTNYTGIGAAVTSGVGNNNTIGANLIFGAAAASTQYIVTTAGNTLTFNGTITSTNSITLRNNAPGTTVFNGALAHTGGFFKEGVGTTTINSSSNTYAGVTTVSNGVLEVVKLANGGNSSSIGASTNAATSLVLSGGTLRYTGSGDSTDRLVRFENTSTIESSGMGAINFTNTASPTVNSSNRGLNLGGNYTGNNTLSWAVTGSLAAGVNRINKTGVGKWILDGSNTYQGNTTITDGVLQFNGSGMSVNSLMVLDGGVMGLGSGNFTRSLGNTPNSTAVMWSTTGTGGGFAAYGADRTVNIGGAGATQTWGATNFIQDGQVLRFGSSDSTHTLNFQNGLDLNGGTREINVANGSAAVDARMNGAISNGALTKTGSGTLSLNATNSYTGATTVSGGTLLVNGSISGSAVTVSSGGRLGGSGTIAGSTTTISANGVHAPGNSPGVQTFNNDNLTYNTSSIFEWELFSNTADLADRGNATIGFDGVDLTGTSVLTIQSGVTARLIFDGSTDFGAAFWTTDKSWLVFDAVSLGQTSLASLSIFDTIQVVDNAVGSAPGAGSFSFSQNGSGDIYLNYTAIPEPSTYAMALGGLAALVFLRRRAKKTNA